MERLHGVCHCTNTLSVILPDNNIIRFVRIFAPYAAELRALIREMALSNASWGEERIANELLLKLGIRAWVGTRRSDNCSVGITETRPRFGGAFLSCTPPIDIRRVVPDNDLNAFPKKAFLADISPY
jgi:hypothetical protein